nr:RNA-binding, CRM domain-containing protein [Tanacetum cinerariifolium]
MEDTTALNYWLNWRFFLCALWVLIAIIAAGTLITKYEVVNKKSSRKRDDELDVEPVGILYEDETWRTSITALHPVWLLAYRLVAFGVLLSILVSDVAIIGAGVLFFYTQWTFALLTFYFAVCMLLILSLWVL